MLSGLPVAPEGSVVVLRIGAATMSISRGDLGNNGLYFPARRRRYCPVVPLRGRRHRLH